MAENSSKSWEYTSKSEFGNNLIKQACEQQKEMDWILTKFVRAEKSPDGESLQ